MNVPYSVHGARQVMSDLSSELADMSSPRPYWEQGRAGQDTEPVSLEGGLRVILDMIRAVLIQERDKKGAPTSSAVQLINGLEDKATLES